MIMFTNMVSGYLDPSVMTYAIQAIAGVVIAIGAVAGIYWRKAKKKVSDKLGIDENKKENIEKGRKKRIRNGICDSCRKCRLYI